MPRRLRSVAASVGVALLALAPVARAQDAMAPEVAQVLAQPRQLGAATFRVLGIPVYRATLYSEAAAFDWQAPLALQLVYETTIPGERLLELTMEELVRIEGDQPDHPALAAALAPCLRDVSAGARYVAHATGADRVTLWRNGAAPCRVDHAGVKRRFLGIWLSPESRAADLSAALRGG